MLDTSGGGSAAPPPPPTSAWRRALPLAFALAILALLAFALAPRAHRRPRRRLALAPATVLLAAASSCSFFGFGNKSVWVHQETLYFHHGVAPGPVMMTREDATVFSERRYEPFGQPIDQFEELVVGGTQTGPIDFLAEPLNSLNKPTDPTTGFSYHGARWMASQTARWLTPDPIVKAPGPKFMAKPWGLHPYQYVDQNPVLYWDPDGRDGVPIPTGGLCFFGCEPLLEDIAARHGVSGEPPLTASEIYLIQGQIAEGFVRGILEPEALREDAAVAMLAASADGPVPAGDVVGGAVVGLRMLRRGARVAQKAASRVRILQRFVLCFAAGTLVLTEEGLIPIEDIDVGDLVWARDDETGEEGWRTVTELFETPEQELLELQFEASDGTLETLRVTPGHPLWSLDDGRWDSAGDLELGEAVEALRGPMRLIAATEELRRETVYNIEVDELHTYFVGNAGVWSHNWCPGASLRGKSLKRIVRAKPTGWRTVKVDSGSGWKWLDRKGRERLRFMRPSGTNPSGSQWSRQSNGYFRWRNEAGEHLDVDGNVVPKTAPDFAERTHIMYEGP
jgi:RHS repeat-associated protein